MNGEHKISSWHRERAALIYLRQSSMVQVREHTESTMRQYGLVEEAVRLGLAAPERRGGDLDTDLGISGRFGRRARRIHRAGGQGLQRRGRCDLRDRDLPAGPQQRRCRPADGVRPDHRHPADRRRRRLRSGRHQRPDAARPQGHYGRGRAPCDGRAAARGQTRRCRTRRAAHPAACRFPLRLLRRTGSRHGDRPRCRSPGRHCRRVHRVRGLRISLWGRRGLRRPEVPAARLRRSVGRSCGGAGSPTPVSWEC